MQAVCVTTRVYENYSLGHLARVENGLNEFGLLPWCTSILILLNMIELKLFLSEIDLLGSRCELPDCCLDLLCVSG